MKTYFRNLWKITPVFLTAVLIAGNVFAQSAQGMKSDVTGEMKMKAGAEKMIRALHMITASLEKQGLMENPAIAQGNAMLIKNKKMVLEGKELMQQSETRIIGKQIIMEGSTKMMKGKDVIVKELKKKGLMKTAALKEDEQALVNGENMMLEGKNLMMDGERNFK